MKQVTGNVADIETMGLVDGPGVRMVVFLQGCPLRCAYCHNPEMLDHTVQKQTFTPEEMVKKIKRYRGYYRDGGVTISGGEPLLQQAWVTEVFKLCQAEGIHTCLDTAGSVLVNTDVLDYTDLVILDVKDLDSARYEELVEMKDNNFYAFVDLCQKKNKKMWLRQVIVPGWNDTEESVLQLKNWASQLQHVEKIELLPYHDMAKSKYKQLGLTYRLEETPVMDVDRCEQLQQLLQ